MDPADHLGSSFLGDDQSFWDDASSYIEIALEPAASNKHTNHDHDDDEYRESSDHNELQLRISFSSTVIPFACPSSSAGEILQENSSSVSDHDEKACKVQKSSTTIKSRSVHQFPAAVNRFLNTILSSRPEIASSSRKLGSNISKRMEGGGGMMMQFLMKLRSKNIGALMESLLIRPVQHHHQVAAHVSPSPTKKKRPGTGSGSNVTQRRKSGKKVLLGNSSGVMGGLKEGGVLVNRASSIGLGRSNGSSPAHPREREMMSRSGGDQCSNIQAAIAHCKTSYGDDVHQSGFQFQTQWTDRCGEDHH